MKKSFKGLALLLCAGLLLTAAAGCASSQADSPAAPAPSASAAPSAAGSSGKAPEPASEPAGEPAVLKVLAVLDERSPQLETLGNYQRIEKEANVKIEWEYIQSKAWKEQKSLVLSSGDLPDVFLGAKSMSTSDIASNIEYFQALDALIEQQGGNIKAMWEEYPNTKIANTYPDGKTYSIGHVMPQRPATEAGIYINKTWLDNLQLPEPKTVEELTDTLRAFRDGDANGNGDPSDEIPMIGRSLTSKYGPAAMRGYFQADNCIESEIVVGEDGKVVYTPVTENYKSWAQWVHLLVAEGLLNNDVVTIDNTRFKALQANEAVSLCGVLSGWTASNAAGWEEQYIPLDIGEGPYGKAYVAANDSNLRSGISGWAIVSVTTACKDPQAAVRWIDLFYEPNNGVESYWGPVGESIEKDADGRYHFIIDEAVDKQRGYHSYDNWYWGLGDGGMGYVPKAMEEKLDISPIDEGKILVDAAYADNIREESYIYPPVILERSLNDTVAEIKTDMDKMQAEKTAKWVVEGGIEDEWDAYLAEMNKMGLERYLEIYQAELDKVRG